MKKRVLSIMLCIVMLVSLLPTIVWAVDANEHTTHNLIPITDPIAITVDPDPAVGQTFSVNNVVIPEGPFHVEQKNFSDTTIEAGKNYWYNDTQLIGSASESGGMFGGMPDSPMGEMPEGMTPPEGFNGERPEMTDNFDPGKMKPDMEGMTPPVDFNGGRMDFERNEDGTITLPDGSVADPSAFEAMGEGSPRPDGNFGDNMPNEAIELSETFTVKTGANYFSFISVKE